MIVDQMWYRWNKYIFVSNQLVHKKTKSRTVTVCLDTANKSTFFWKSIIEFLIGWIFWSLIFGVCCVLKSLLLFMLATRPKPDFLLFDTHIHRFTSLLKFFSSLLIKFLNLRCRSSLVRKLKVQLSSSSKISQQIKILLELLYYVHTWHSS